MQSNFLTRLQRNGVFYIVAAILLLAGIPLYQLLVLLPQGYSTALASADRHAFIPYLSWIADHLLQFLGYRLLLLVAFTCLFTLPFTLFRIIVAQELLGPEDKDDDEDEESEDEDNEGEENEEATDTGMPPYAWRGKGFAVLAAWAGVTGIVSYLLGTLASTMYLALISSGTHTSLPASFPTLSALFAIITNTVGGGLLAISLLLFGAVIARRGRNLWPGIWVAFGYAALALTALFSGSAVAVASAPGEGQAALTTPAILLFGVWTLWFGVMLVRLKPEA